MAAQNKTQETHADVAEFIASAVAEQQRADAYALVELLSKASGYKPVMWGSNIIGFGRYHYRYASGHEGDAALVGFSPRKAAFSLYIFTGLPEHENLLEGLGKYSRGKACIYVKKLSDIDPVALTKLVQATIAFLQAKYPS